MTDIPTDVPPEHSPPGSPGHIRLGRRDWTFIFICIAVAAASLIVILRYFNSAFPEASIDFRYDRNSSRVIAENVLRGQGFNTTGMKHTVVFDADDSARIFLERSLGLERANKVMRRDVRLWYWHHRWFRPQQEEEFSVDIAPTGEVVSMTRQIPESRPMPAIDQALARQKGEQFLTGTGTVLADVLLISQSERKLPGRVQRIFTWESRSVKPAGAPYRHTITVDGDSVSSYGQQIKVPEQWLRSYRDLRSKNGAAGNIDTIFMIMTMIAALSVFIIRLRRGDLRLRFLLSVGAVAVVLVGLVTANSIPSVLAGYNTTMSYPAFIAQTVVFSILQSIATAMLLIVICGAGEVMYRERLPKQIAIPRLWSRRSLTSKRVFDSLILGYTLVLFFIGYQVVFYLAADHFGAWSPAEIPYSDILNTALPWVAVLFAGFFPAFSEEFLSRAFSIPFFEKVLRSRIGAIILAGFIWGFGHATYPNQPFYIRGLEVGLAGVLLGFLLYRYGLLALLIWHYTVDAVYTALLLFKSGNTYYVVSAAAASLVFAIPLIVSIVLYFRNRGFIPDDDLTNAALPVTAPPPAAVGETAATLPQPIRVTRRSANIAITVLIIAGALIAFQPPSPQDVVNYRLSSDGAKRIAATHLRQHNQQIPEKIAAVPVSAFRQWEAGSSREEGGSPGGFDETAATYMLQHGMRVEQIVDVMRTRVQAATWIVRFFTPMQKTEYFVEIDPRTARVIGYHKYADERARGARLEREQALAVANTAFATYGARPGTFEVQEALSFQQPNRRDWLFHFKEQPSLAAEAEHRVSIRVMGDEITQYASTIRVPDEVYRKASERTLVNVILIALKIIGMVGGLALLVTGMIAVTRQSGFGWQRAARVTAMLAIIPVMSALSGFESQIFGYNTSISWQTFMTNLATGTVMVIGRDLLMIFLAVAGINATYPYARSVLSREGVRRFGRSAAVSALAAIGAFISGRELLRVIVRQFPTLMSVNEVSVPDVITLPLPSLFELGSAIMSSVVFAGAVALFVAAMRSWKREWVRAAVTIAVVFCFTLDVSARPGEIPMMIAMRLSLGVLVWLIGRYALNGNLLAWPLAAFTASLLQGTLALAQNDRADLRVHAAVLFVIAAVTLIVIAMARTSEEPAAEGPIEA